MRGLDGKSVDRPHQALLEYELCKHFGWTVNELYEQPNHTIEAFVEIINAIAEHDKKASKKQKRDDVKAKFGNPSGGR
ncbi:aldolase/citrate lyase family protein [Bacillus phage Blastoid]|uniref:Aldolase/citrate lyase family protein n=1 Tax=Bacillus phage Blastoid TaxID=2880540 RepID=U5PS86_9CAUD|nr:tail assembly chaperone [Bacillus phage Blastoid]AGY46825.1 aldolase/citrate lyase family protein [Bacillus phage Blastoid]